MKIFYKWDSNQNVNTNDDADDKRTSTIAWRFTTWTPTSTSTECALCHTSSLITHTHLAQVESCTVHPISMPCMRVVVSLFTRPTPLIDPSLQDNVIIQSGFFQHISHMGCAVNLHSMINNGLIPEGRMQARDRKYSFCLLIPETKAIKILQRFTSMKHVENNICTVLGRNILTRYFGSILIFRSKKD